ncbi:MAG TPA: lysine--tRNA ligase, partial [Methylococcaceae bacterium]|nr:lysine--tRNA ligase [Methylococcaceae bacterium]
MNDLLDENKLTLQRREKLKAIREQEGIAFPNDFRRNALAQDLLNQYEALESEELEAKALRVSLGGRLMTKRVMGKASFAHLQDMSGRLQVFLQRDTLPEGVYEAFKGWDMGDIIGVEGVLFKTKTGELSVRVDQARLLTKSLRPLPEKFHGLQDAETCYRQRYLDLIMNEDSRKVFLLRSAI